MKKQIQPYISQEMHDEIIGLRGFTTSKITEAALRLFFSKGDEQQLNLLQVSAEAEYDTR